MAPAEQTKSMCVGGVLMHVGQKVKIALEGNDVLYGKIDSFREIYPGTPVAFWLVTVDVDAAYHHLTLGCRYFGTTTEAGGCISLLD
mgnify:CR=1 FL=1